MRSGISYIPFSYSFSCRFEIEMEFSPCARLNDGRCGWWYAVAPSIHLLLFFGLLFFPVVRTGGLLSEVARSAELLGASSIPYSGLRHAMLRQAHAKVSPQIPDTKIYLLPLTLCWFSPPAISYKSNFYITFRLYVLIFLFFLHDYILNTFCWSLCFLIGLYFRYLNMRKETGFCLFISLFPFLLP